MNSSLAHVVLTYSTVAAPYLAAGALLLALIALFMQLSLRRRFLRLSLGRNGSFEESLTVLAREMKETKEFRDELETYLKHVETRLRGSLQGLGVVRFNPFEGQGQGGNQSFAAAFLDESGNGVVLSTLHVRERALVYAKPVQGGNSPYELTAEEKRALAIAKESVAGHRKK